MANIKIDKEVIYVQIDNEWRNIGVIRNNVLNVYRTRSKHLMRNFNAYGFNKDIIDSDKYFEYIALQETNMDEKNVFFIPREDILLEGRLYKAKGFDNQYFMSLNQLESYRVEE